MSNTEPNSQFKSQLPPPAEGTLPEIGIPIPVTENAEQFLGASNAHMSGVRMAQMRANVEAGFNPSGFGRLPGVEAPGPVPDSSTAILDKQ